MTVALELSRRAQSLEYLLAIEGVGWPTPAVNGGLGSLAGTWQGTVFASGDTGGDLEAQLGCTVIRALHMPRGLSETFDPESQSISVGGLEFVITDAGEFMDTIFRTHLRTNALLGKLTGANGTLTGLPYFHDNETTVKAIYTDATPAQAGDVVWIGGSEAVLLGARTPLGGDAYSYADCTRGYLGTYRGNSENEPWKQLVFQASGLPYGGMFWPGTTIYPWNPYWQGRRTMLVARVPGTAQLAALAHGVVGEVERRKSGAEWVVSTAARVWPTAMRRKPSLLEGITATERTGAMGTSGAFVMLSGALPKILLHYAYRSVPGGTAGALNASASAPQSEVRTQGGFEFNLSYRPVRIGKRVGRLRETEQGVAGQRKAYHIEFGHAQDLGAPRLAADAGTWPAVLMLDNALADPTLNPFSVNGRVTRNPIDYALTLLTSMDDESFIADAAAGGSATVINFTAPGFTVGQWEGFALHCVEGANKGQARVILSNTTSAITVATPFGSAAHQGNQYQIRNSVYDTLPFGFGMKVRSTEIGIAEWETLRDTHGASWEIGNVVLGVDDNEDLWSLIEEGIFRVFGVVPVLDRDTGRLIPRYVGQTYTDGILETYPAVTQHEVLPGSLESIDMMPRPDIAQIVVNTRGDIVTAAIPEIGRVNPWSNQPDYGIVRWKPLQFVADALVTAPPSVIVVRVEELDRVLRGTGRVLTVDAMLCGTDQIDMLRAIQTERLYSIAVAAPESELIADTRRMLEFFAGGIIKLTDGGRTGAVDPYTHAAGLTNHICRILSFTVEFATSRVRMAIQLLGRGAGNLGLLAPALVVTAKAAGPHRFLVTLDSFTDGVTRFDWDPLAAGDLLELRDVTGALKGGPYVIASFGSNEASTPAAAASAVINVTAEITEVIAAGDYVAFPPWSASNTTNMARFAAYADPADGQLGVDDEPQVWG